MLVLPLECFFYVPEFCYELLVHLCRAPATFALTSACWGGLFLSLEEVILGNQPSFFSGTLQTVSLHYRAQGIFLVKETRGNGHVI